MGSILFVLESQGRNIDFFLSAEKYMIHGDPELVTFLNEQLELDPEYEIPPVKLFFRAENLDLPKNS